MKARRTVSQGQRRSCVAAPDDYDSHGLRIAGDRRFDQNDVSEEEHSHHPHHHPRIGHLRDSSPDVLDADSDSESERPRRLALGVVHLLTR